MFTVYWPPQARADLATAWTTAPDRQAVTDASDRADVLLETDPVGRSRFLAEGLWRLDVPPLALFFEIDQTRRLVRVLQVSLVA